MIAIKAELAGRLLPDDLARAAAEVNELEGIARGALGAVRDAMVEIRDDGSGCSGASSDGNGRTGLRERADEHRDVRRHRSGCG